MTNPAEGVPERDLDKSVELLKRTFPSGTWSVEHLRWMYDENPCGSHVCDVDADDGARVVHVGGIGLPARVGSLSTKCFEVVNAVTAPIEQRRGRFTASLSEIDAAMVEQGAVFGYGVTNDQSSDPSRGLYQNSDFGPLAVRVVPGVVVRRESGVVSRVVDSEMLTSPAFAELTDSILLPTGNGLAIDWTPDFLRWRLSRPHSSYTLHVSSDLIAISTRTLHRRVPVAVIMKLFRRHGSPLPADPKAVIRSARHHHGAPFAIYAGFNPDAPVKGIPVPRKLRPKPLNLLTMPFVPVAEGYEWDVFEFLEFDAF